jgi:hypothetical protein
LAPSAVLGPGVGPPGGPGMMGGGHGRGGSGDERETWLTEDENVWGAVPGVAPGIVLGREIDEEPG